MDRPDFSVLEELFDKIEELQRRTGSNPSRAIRSSFDGVRRDLAKFADRCRRKEVKGRARKRESGRLFLKILSLDPQLWNS